MMFPLQLSHYGVLIIIASIYLSTTMILQQQKSKEDAIEIENEKVMIRKEMDAEIADSQAERVLEIKQEDLYKQEKIDAEKMDLMSRLHLEETLQQETDIILREMQDIDFRIGSGRIEVIMMNNTIVDNGGGGGGGGSGGSVGSVGGLEIYGNKQAGTILFFDKETDKVTAFGGTKAQTIQQQQQQQQQAHTSTPVIDNRTEVDADSSFPVEAPSSNTLIQECNPSDAIMVSKNGVTMFDKDTSPIRITSQNNTHVEFKVVNTFSATFKSVFTEYDTGMFGQTECLEEQNIKPLSVISSNFKADCTGSTDMYAIVKIWFSNDANNNGDDNMFMLSPNDNAIIPKCCQPRDDEEVFTVMYAFKLSCVNPCNNTLF
jgi:hypothetical protein